MSSSSTLPESRTEHRLFLLQKHLAELAMELGDVLLHLQSERKLPRMPAMTVTKDGDERTDLIFDRPLIASSDPFGDTLGEGF